MAHRQTLTIGLFLGAALFPSGASATLPGANGPLIYTQAKTTPFDDGSNDYSVFGDLRTVGLDGVAGPSLFATEKSEDNAAISPNGLRVAFSRTNRIWVGNVDGTGAHPVGDTEGGLDGLSFAPDNRTVVFTDDSLGLRSIDTAAAKPRAKTLVRAGVSRGKYISIGIPRHAPDGTLRYLRADSTNFGARIKVAVSVWSANGDGSAARRLFTGSGDTAAIWSFDLSPDGSKLALVASNDWRKNPRRLFVTAADGSGARVLTTASATDHSYFGFPAWSPDGRSIALPQNASKPANGAQIDLVDTTSGARRTLVSIPSGRLEAPAWRRVEPRQ